jgi:hypothetical protein
VREHQFNLFDVLFFICMGIVVGATFAMLFTPVY